MAVVRFIVILPKIVWKVHFAFYNQKAAKKRTKRWELNLPTLGTNASTLPLRCYCFDNTGGIGDPNTKELKKKTAKKDLFQIEITKTNCKDTPQINLK